MTSCQPFGHTCFMLKNVAVVVLDRVEAFELGVVCEVFGIDRIRRRAARLRLRGGGGRAGPDPLQRRASPSTPRMAWTGWRRPTWSRCPRCPTGGWGRPAGSPASPRRGPIRPGLPASLRRGAAESGQFPGPLLAALRRAADRGAWVLSVCSGVFVLGEAGLLEGRRCTTHWRHTAELARRYPSAKVDPGVLYVDEQPVITSAGTAAGIDACLHLVRKEQGSRVANGIARRMVVPPHRDGGQAQYIDRPLAETSGGSLGEVLDWMALNLGRPLTVGDLAGPRAHVAPHVRAALRAGDRHHAAALAHLPAHPAGPADAGGHRRDRGRHRRAGRLRQRGYAAAPLPGLARHHARLLPPPVPRAGRGRPAHGRPPSDRVPAPASAG